MSDPARIAAPGGARGAISAGLLGGLTGGVTIWIYEEVVQAWLMKTAAPYAIVENTAVLCFGPAVRALGPGAFALGVVIHFATALAWGLTFAFLWPALKARGVEATLAALVFGIVAWMVMHNVLLATFSPNPPVYTTLSVINGLMSHTLAFAVPLALVVKAKMAAV